MLRASGHLTLGVPATAVAAALATLLLPACALAREVRLQDRKEGQEEKVAPIHDAATYAGLKWRGIGPALPSGRISDLAVDPTDPDRWFVAVASGGLWRTVNHGTTFEPVFDDTGSYSIGCVTLDPNNPHVVWVGTGENNAQRSVSFGDGVYRSLDGGRHWENMGLKESEHIGRILVDPRDSDVVFVAAQGPLWRDGGDRGLYKSTDGGRSWRKVLDISPRTGINEVVMDPRDPDVLYASAWQRRRHVWVLLDGGPESGIWKSTDGGETWRRLEHGLPEEDMGRIGLAVSPADPDIVYAIIEAARGKGGVYRSTDRGETWEKRGDYMSSSPQYYNELVADPRDPDKVYSLDTFLHVSEDGGKTFHKVPEKNKHVDNHALWVDPTDTRHLLAGCDGGLYETWDAGHNWHYKANLPVVQFYRVSADNAQPFYRVYGGTQDNNSLGAPSRTTDRMGIGNEHWFVTVGGDGYEAVADPEDPDIVYTQWQYGGLVRYDHRSGEIVDIKPREEAGDAPFRWNWDSPLIISPHAHTRLYFAANILFRSDDRGDTWRKVSGDLTRQLDRNALKVMDRVWSVDAVAKNRSTSFYGNIVSLAESPLVEGLLYVGTDDGLVQVSEDGGEHWRREEHFPGVPEMAYVSRLEADRFDPDTVYAAFDNHKMGDFRPYLLKSTDRGRSWVSIAGDLPERHVVLALVQDHVKPELLFAGTEFGVFFTLDGGTHWTKLKGGMPVISVRDLEIQRREDDLIAGTFGRGIYILDDYSPLRRVTPELLEEEAVLFPVKDAWLYVERSRLGGRKGRGSQGAAFYAAPNPPFGAVLTYRLKEKLRSRKEARQEAERKLEKEGGDVHYPSWEELRAEDREEAPRVLLTVRDEAGAVVRRLEAPRDKGFHRAPWDLRLPAAVPVRLEKPKELAPWEEPDKGPLVLPGTYTVTLSKVVDGRETVLAGPEPFQVVPLGLAKLPAADAGEAMAFYRKVARLRRAVRGALEAAGEGGKRLKALRKAVLATPAAETAALAEIEALHQRLEDLLVPLRGDRTVSSRNEPVPPSIRQRVENITDSQWSTTSGPTTTQRRQYQMAAEAFAPVLADLQELLEEDLPALEARLESAGAPWTPGRVPRWKME